MNLHELFGRIEFIRSKRAKHIRVRIHPTSLKVSLPPGATEEQAIKFIQSEHKSILAKQERLRLKEETQPTVFNENSTLQTFSFKVVFKRTSRKDIHFSLKESILTVEFPENTDCSERQTQEHFWNGIKYFLKKEAKKHLPERVKILSDLFGFWYLSVKIQPSKTRWGSCSRDKNINLSFYLMLLPGYLIDYVILHELCHTKVMNHSHRFWHIMDSVTDGRSKELRQELKKYNIPE